MSEPPCSVDVVCMILISVVCDSLLGLTPFSRTKNDERAHANSSPERRRGLEVTENAVLKPGRIEAGPLAGDRTQVPCTHGINLFDQNALQLVNRIRRTRENADPPGAIERRVGIEKQPRHRFPNGSAMFQIFPGRFHGETACLNARIPRPLAATAALSNASGWSRPAPRLEHSGDGRSPGGNPSGGPDLLRAPESRPGCRERPS